jgi:hypothetical protein
MGRLGCSPDRDDVLSVGAVARVARVAPRTVVKWIDGGSLPGYRIALSHDRRVRREDLIAFLRRHGMPLWELERPPCVLLAGLSGQDAGRIAEALGGGITTVEVADPYEAGLAVGRHSPKAAVVGPEWGLEAARAVASRLSAAAVGVVAVLAEDTPDWPAGLAAAQFRLPLDAAGVAGMALAILATPPMSARRRLKVAGREVA